MIRLIEEIRFQIASWGKGRWWLPRGVLVTYLAYLAFQLLSDSTSWSLFAPVNLGIHETGHLVFRLSGVQFWEIAGGTIAQLACPLILIVSFLQQGDLFAPSFGAYWLGTNLCNISVYMADARARALHLVTVGGGKHIIHDWDFLLTRLGVLSWDTFLGDVVWVLSFLMMFGACAYGFWVCHLIAGANIPQSESPENNTSA